MLKHKCVTDNSRSNGRGDVDAPGLLTSEVEKFEDGEYVIAEDLALQGGLKVGASISTLFMGSLQDCHSR